MRHLRVTAMTEADLDEAAILLAARPPDHLTHQPLLDPAHAEPGTARTAMTWDDETTGAIARLGGELVGYLYGRPKSTASLGSNVWMESAGLAVQEAEVARDLYAVAAAGWVERGLTAHYVLVPAHDAALPSTSASRGPTVQFLGFAAVSPHVQGQGMGRALGEAVIGWALEHGYRSVVIDWWATNLLSSRTWPRLGFVPTFARLHRLVGY